MSNEIKDIDTKNRTYVINIKNLIEIILEQIKSHILIYYIGYVTIKDSKYFKINSVSSLYIVFNNVNGYFEEINGNKYLTLVLTNESKK